MRRVQKLLGGPLMHVISAKAVSFGEVLTGEFKQYAQQVITNAKRLGEKLQSEGVNLVSGGTDNHLLLLDLQSLDLTGKVAEHALDSVGITTNKNTMTEHQAQALTGIYSSAQNLAEQAKRLKATIEKFTI